jgi:hypothetical protein
MILAKRAAARYHAMPASERLRRDYLQRKSIAKGMCPDSRDYKEHCQSIDDHMPDPANLTDAQIGLLLNNSPWHL